MNHFIEHIPAFSSGIEPKEYEFNTLPELLAIPFIQHFINHQEKPFLRLSLHENRLMAEFEEGLYFVLGFIMHPEEILLPRFRLRRESLGRQR
jgi:hypothetical protein